MDLFSPLNCLTFAFQRASRKFVREFEVETRHLRLSAPQFTTLALLSGHGTKTIGALADLLGTERTTVSRNLSVLAKRGWISSVDSDDQRLNAVAISLSGQAILDQALPIWRKFQTDLLEEFGNNFAAKLLDKLATR